jgi:methionyl-tRNA formyltransferase
VYFLGSGAIAVALLRQLTACPDILVVGCGTQPDRPQGRRRVLTPTPVGRWARDHQLVVDQPASVNTPEFLARLGSLRPELVLVFAFGQILRDELLVLPPLGCINVHASLLPKYRGAAPVTAAIAAGDQVTGISVMRMTRGLDCGPVYARFECALNGTENAGTLSAQLGELAAHTVPAVLLAIAAGTVTPQPQDEARASLAPKLHKSDGRVRWYEPAAVIERRVRAYCPWPGAWFMVTGPRQTRQLTITRAAVRPATGRPAPGTVVQADKSGWSVACGENILEIHSVIPEGRSEMTGTEFIRGFQIQLGTVLNEADHCQLGEPADPHCLRR